LGEPRVYCTVDKVMLRGSLGLGKESDDREDNYCNTGESEEK
jgi:hypothetical protein